MEVECVEKQEMKAEYQRQQTREGREALRVRRELGEIFSKVLNRPFRVGVVRPLVDGRTGETTGYFIAE